MSDENLVLFDEDEEEEPDYEYEIPIRVTIMKDDEIIYSHPFVNLQTENEDMDEKLKETVSKFLMNNIYHNEKHTRVTYDFFSIEYFNLDNYKILYVYFMDDDEAKSRLLSDFIKTIGVEEKAVSLLMKQRIANNKEGTDQMLEKYFPLDQVAIDEMKDGFQILFGDN